MMLSITRFSSVLFLFVTLSAFAQSYPSKPIRIVVPYPAGGTTDIIGRIAASELTRSLGQPVMVDNKPGASGMIGASEVARASPDGYTLLLSSIGTQGLNSALFKNLPYDPENDFAPISLIASTPNVIVINSESKARDFPSLLNIAKSPEGLMYGATTPGGSPNMSAQLVKAMVGGKLVPVTYKGAAPMLVDLVAGHIQVAFDNLPSAMPLIRSGKIQPVAVTTANRWPGLPNVPTISESGLPGYDVSGWFGLAAPAGTPPQIIEKISAAVASMLESPAVKEKLLEQGALPTGNTPEEFTVKIRGEIERWKKVVKETGMPLLD